MDESNTLIHFVGIGGVGMSGIAHLLLQEGIKVSGSDVKESSYTRALREAGAVVFIGHRAENVHGASEVVVSTAIKPTNPEIIEARRLGIPIRHRSEKLAELLDARRGITVAGTHGKTTTSSMAATMLTHVGFAPSFAVGGTINTEASNARGGKSEWFVAEADESDGSLVNFHPEFAIVTNIELDHTDFYEKIEQVYDVFRAHIQNIKRGGTLLACCDDEGVRKVLGSFGTTVGKSSRIRNNEIKLACYGLSPDATYQAKVSQIEAGYCQFQVFKCGLLQGEIRLSVPGLHNVLNALAVFALGCEIGIATDKIIEALHSFRGVRRRFQIVGKNEHFLVIDDYAHHPTEIRATLAAARATHSGRIIALFQPHRYSRTKSLADEFGAAFADADVVVLADIYPASEDPIANVSSELILESLKKHGHPRAFYVGALDSAEEFVVAHAQPGDLILTLGAGDVTKCAPALAKKLGCAL
ncbi:MAG: UDP-N-acetylmuramate--L-alanine ligase [Candidatus Sumerlaeaceae bacterium]|nr:UDP-N-acetylmuramate--L-alanine ligase [Candidatus Sumerlaeaceae bacterium]